MAGDLVPVIGLEVHVQLATRTKMFCADLAAYGAPPNTLVCPVCLGLPGALPVANRRAVELGVIAALGLHCTVHPMSSFDRKSYFYPDLPRGYQITQRARPLATGGYLDVERPEGPGRIRIRTAHLEEDTGRSLHDRVPGATALDFNRAGVPLLEIVTAPDLRSPEEARAFLQRLKLALEYMGVSDCSMERGSLRVDANVSVRRPGEQLGAGTEIKNLNSFSGVARALRHEVARQSALRDHGEPVEAETLLWDATAGEARPMRGKQGPEEYRYLPEPDLPPIELEPEWVDTLRTGLPEMPWARAARIESEYSLPESQAEALTASRAVADYFEETVRSGAGAMDAASWVMGEVRAAALAADCAPTGLEVDPPRLAQLIALVRAGAVSRPAARTVFELMLDSDAPPAELVARESLALAGSGETGRWVDEAIREHPVEAGRMRAGEERLVDFFVGRVMRSSRGRADPVVAAQLVRERLGRG